MIRLRVKEIAEARKISISQLAKLADVDYKTVRKVFRNPQVAIDLYTLDKLCWALRVTPAELIEYKRTAPPLWRAHLEGEEGEADDERAAGSEDAADEE
jgi:DNA-binding Xre family transcriptional regulator